MCSNKSGRKWKEEQKYFPEILKIKLQEEENILCRLFNIEAGYDSGFKVHVISYLNLTILNFTWPNTPGKPK